MPDTALLRAFEEALLDPEVRTSPRFAQLLADDFVEFGSSGRVFGKADVLDAAARLPAVDTPLDAFAVQYVSAECALVTYRSTTRFANGSSRESLRSSMWVWRDDRWQLRFHQGTPAAASAPDEA